MAVSVSLGPRLQLVASYVPEGSQLGDIGTDHAYLPVYLWETGKIHRAVAVDVHEGPYRSACSAIESRNLEKVIDVRFGDGLKPVQAGEVDTLTLCGMGGNTMLEIFAARPQVMSRVKDLILQPQGAEGKVRLSLLQEGWKMKQESFVVEEGRIYVVMHYSRQEGYTLKELHNKAEQLIDRLLNPSDQDKDQGMKRILKKWAWEFGPLNLEYPTEELKILLKEQIQTLSRTIGEMQKSNQEKVLKRIQEYNLTVKGLEEIEKCLFPSV